uniref:T-cell surface glycoprotein CD3 zeta chain n=1 Tax=Fundulus heteroclitus TaxID=8078 RepID=A0A3Q2QZA9_FUNHE
MFPSACRASGCVGEVCRCVSPGTAASHHFLFHFISALQRKTCHSGCRCTTRSSVKKLQPLEKLVDMALRTWVPGLLVLASLLPSAAAGIEDPQLCYVLDGFLGLYGLIITGMFIREKFFKTKVKGFEEPTYAGLVGGSADTYEPLTTDPERGRNRRVADDSTYTGLQRRTEPTYKELPVKRERQRKNEQVYQGLSSATRDTYDSLQMQPLPAR